MTTMHIESRPHLVRIEPTFWQWLMGTPATYEIHYLITATYQQEAA